MPDANALRQERHDRCRRLCACPECGAKENEACRSVDYMDPESLRQSIAYNAMATGKTFVSTQAITHQMMKLAYRKQHIGGLHRARWVELEHLHVVIRLSELVDGESGVEGAEDSGEEGQEQASEVGEELQAT